MAPPSDQDPESHAANATLGSDGSADEAGQDGASRTSASATRPHHTGPGPADEETPQDLAPRPRRDTITSFETRVLVNELQCLVGGFLDKAYQPRRDEVLLRFRAPEVGRRDLYYKRGAFFCFTEHRPENPTKPPGFAMAIRKHLGGGRVFKVEQLGFDRVVVIWVQRRDGDHRIVFELFADGNCVLVRPDGKILVPLVPESWAARTIRSGAPYQPPPPRVDPWTFDEAAFITKAREGNRDLVRALALAVGLGGKPAEEVVARAGAPKDEAIEDVDDTTLSSCYAAWDALRREVDGGKAQAGVLLSEGRAIDATAIDSAVVRRELDGRPDELQLRHTPTFSAALDALFLAGRKAQEKSVHVAAAQDRLTKLERQRLTQEKAVEKFRHEITEKAQQGETLFAHFQTVERIRQQILGARKRHDWKEIQRILKEGADAGNEDAARVVRVDPNQGRVVLRLEDPNGDPHEIPIDIRLDVTENANAAYERSKTARQKLAGAEEALKGTLEKMAAAERSRADADAAVEDAMRETKHTISTSRHHWFEAFRWCFAPDGTLVVGGRDAGSNDRVVKKHLEDGDRYVHADVHGAPSVVIKVDSDEPSKEALETAGCMTVTCSRSFGRTGSGDAYWVTPPQVSKTPQAGEFLARGAFIVRGERQWMRKLPLTWSIGVVRLGRAGTPLPPDEASDDATVHDKLMGGPIEAVHAHSVRWVDVESGTVKRSEIVKQLSRAFGAHPDAVDRALPTGDLRIVAHKGVKLEPEAPQ